MIKKLKIGNVELENNLVLGPMAGYTNLPFRIICEKYNPGLEVTEMVSAKGLYYDDSKTKELFNTTGQTNKISVQIFGSDVKAMGYAAKYLSENNIGDIIDINMGCPAPKIVKNEDGSKLLLNLDLAEDVVRAVVDNSTKPVTVKIRKGWDHQHIVAVEAAKRIEKAGASAIAIHGRTRSDYYTGIADWDIIKQVKENVGIPVIGNGDIKTPEDAKRIFEQTNVDGIMIARGTLGNPWIFKQIKEYLETSTYSKITNEELLKVMLEHIDLEIKDKGEYTGIREMRKHISFYIKGLKDASEMRNRVNKIENKEELKQTLIEYLK